MKRIPFLLSALLLLGIATPASANHPAHCPDGPNGGTVIHGTDGADGCLLVGGNGKDSIWGYGGDDLLVGNHGYDDLHGGPGDDVFYPGRGPDIVRCGGGYDVVHQRFATGADSIGGACEVVK